MPSSATPSPSGPFDKTVTACLIIIGNEILSGRTQDANLGYLAKELTELGIRLREVRVIPDVTPTIVATVNEMRRKFDYVFTTGGIGPTHDDITSPAIAEAFGVACRIDPEARRLLEERIGVGQLNEARLRMASVPEGATLIHNALSAAPGFQIGNVYVMAGVPRVMQSMFEALKPHLEGGARMLSRTVVCGLPEGTIAAGLSALQDRYGDLEIGSYPQFEAGGYRTSLVLRGTSAERLAAAIAELSNIIRDLGGAPHEESGAETH